MLNKPAKLSSKRKFIVDDPWILKLPHPDNQNMPHFVCFCFVSIFPPLKKLCSNIKQTLQLSELFSVVHNRLSRLRSYHSHVCFCRKAFRHLIACIARVFLGKRKLPSPSPGSKIRNDVTAIFDFISKEDWGE